MMFRHNCNLCAGGELFVARGLKLKAICLRCSSSMHSKCVHVLRLSFCAKELVFLSVKWEEKQ